MTVQESIARLATLRAARDAKQEKVNSVDPEAQNDRWRLLQAEIVALRGEIHRTQQDPALAGGLEN